MNDRKRPTKQQKMAMIVAVGLGAGTATLMLSRTTPAMSDVDAVSFASAKVGTIQLQISTVDVEYVETIRYVFDAVGERPVSNSSPYYLVAKGVDVGTVEGQVLDLPAKGEAMALEVPIAFSLEPGAFCERFEITAVPKEAPVQTLSSTSCFTVDAEGTSHHLGDRGLSELLYSYQDAFDPDGSPVQVITVFDERDENEKNRVADANASYTFAVPVHGGGLVGYVRPADLGVDR